MTGRPLRHGPVVRSCYCWGHFRRRFYDIAKAGNALVATEALDRIGAIYV